MYYNAKYIPELTEFSIFSVSSTMRELSVTVLSINGFLI